MPPAAEGASRSTSSDTTLLQAVPATPGDTERKAKLRENSRTRHKVSPMNVSRAFPDCISGAACSAWYKAHVMGGYECSLNPVVETVLPHNTALFLSCLLLSGMNVARSGVVCRRKARTASPLLSEGASPLLLFALWSVKGLGSASLSAAGGGTF